VLNVTASQILDVMSEGMLSESVMTMTLSLSKGEVEYLPYPSWGTPVGGGGGGGGANVCQRHARACLATIPTRPPSSYAASGGTCAHESQWRRLIYLTPSVANCFFCEACFTRVLPAFLKSKLPALTHKSLERHARAAREATPERSAASHAARA